MKLPKNSSLIAFVLSLAGLAAVHVSAQGGDQTDPLPSSEEFPSSPVLRIERGAKSAVSPPAQEGFRTIDGSGNNLRELQMGAVGVHLQRWTDADYGDGVSSLAGAHRPSAREVSNAVCAQSESMPNELGVTDFIWQWGQFLDHDLSLTEGVDPAEPANIVVPTGDSFFDPTGQGGVTMDFNRAIYDPVSGSNGGNPREQINEITAWIDASNVYGSEDERAEALRAHDGTGRLATSAGDMMPFNTAGLPNAGGTSPTLFLGGDVRANEQVGLAAIHTLFVREHNFQADRIRAENAQLDGDQVYQRARRILGAQMQVITYREFLPALLGPDALRPYQGYRDDVDASIANDFSTAAYRFGHSTLSPSMLRLSADGSAIDAGHLALRDAFFQSHRLTTEGGLAPIFRGLSTQVAQAVDAFIIDDLRNFLFGPPGAGGFDLASLNIQRGRDHGIGSYNEARRAFGMPPARDFDDVSSDPEVQARLQAAYADVDDIDLWVGGLSEDRRQDAMVGNLFFRIIRRQFEALRDGDRYWYSRVLNTADRELVEGTRLSDIIRRNTAAGFEVQDDVFHATDGDAGIIFADGFESGGPGGWSAVIGGN
ncbi:MAG: peroxidase family protein [Acidobacteriota bacterium]